MKRVCTPILLVLCVFLISSCAQSAKVTLQVDELKLNTGGFGWPGAEYGTSLIDLEKQTGYTFPPVPFSSDRGERLRNDFDEKEVFDYRNDSNYGQATFQALQNGTGVLVEYGVFTGNLLFEFYHDELRTTYVYFGNKPVSIDPDMNFGGKKNDVAAVYESLLEDLTRYYGDPEQIAMPEVDQATWAFSPTDGAVEKYRLSLTHSFPANGDEMTVLQIGYWVKES